MQLSTYQGLLFYLGMFLISVCLVCQPISNLILEWVIIFAGVLFFTLSLHELFHGLALKMRNYKISGWNLGLNEMGLYPRQVLSEKVMELSDISQVCHPFSIAAYIGTAAFVEGIVMCYWDFQRFCKWRQNLNKGIIGS